MALAMPLHYMLNNSQEMTMILFRRLFAVLILLCATQAQAEVEAGKDYGLLKSPQAVSGDKIEVLEFFYYGCPHCYHFHPQLHAWGKKLPKDVALRYVPVTLWDEPIARAFFALETMGQIEKLHNDFFEAYNVFKIDLSSEDKITEFVSKHGVDKAKFSNAYHSFDVDNKVKRTNMILEIYDVTYHDHKGGSGTPSIVVDGKFKVFNRESAEDTMKALNSVIDIARKERRGSKH
jgi:thiol:disulfide interchange protein DsbA